MIEEYTFGKMIVRGKTYRHDIKIARGEVIPDWWRKQGHRLSLDDIQDLLSVSPALLIIGTGQSGVLQVPAPVKQSVIQRGIELIDVPTAEAVALFNTHFLKKDPVAAGFHLTC